MDHQGTLLFTLATAFVIAFIFGYIANRLKLPVLVGYLLAGIAIGPFTPGFHANSEMAGQLAEIGVILLMFGVGLHFSTADLMAVKGIAIPGAVGQIAVATAIGTLIAMSWGWSLAAGLVLGLALSVASTVVVLRALEERGAIESANGRIAIAWLVVEDLAMVLTLVLLPALAGLAGGTVDGHPVVAQSAGALALMIAITLVKIAAFLAIVSVAGPRVVPWILQQAARSGSHELFTLSVLAVSLGIAYGAATLFGISFALGAFCAGVVLSNTELSHRAAEESLPLQHAFAVIFFVSVGMLFDPHILTRQPLEVAAVMMIILVGKSIAAFIIVQAMGYPITTALTVSASLAQIGEFSFILAGLGISLGIFPAEGRDMILAGALISLAVNPLTFMAVAPLQRLLRGRRGLTARFAPAQDLKLARLQVLLDGNKKGTKALPPDELVGRWQVFADLDLIMRAELLTLFRPRTAVPGERLIRKGDAANEIFFISAGAVEVSVGGRKIKLGPGDLFGEMGLLSDAPRNADVTAIDYSQLLTLDRAGFQSFIGKHPELRARIDLIAAQRLAQNQVPPPPPAPPATLADAR